MNPESLVLPIWKPIVKDLEGFSEITLSALLIILAIVLVWLAMQKDHLVWKAVILTYIFMP